MVGKEITRIIHTIGHRPLNIKSIAVYNNDSLRLDYDILQYAS